MTSKGVDIIKTRFVNWFKVAPDVSTKVYWYIFYASIRLNLSLYFSEILGHLGWCLEIYLINLPLLNAFARSQLVWIALLLWPYRTLFSQDLMDSESNQKDKEAWKKRKEKATQKVTKNVRTVSLFLCILLALHHEQSPVKSGCLRNIAEWMFERKLVLAIYVLAMQGLTRSPAIASMSLSGFFYIVRLWNLMARILSLVMLLVESEVWVRVEPFIPFLVGAPIRLAWSVLQIYLFAIPFLIAKFIFGGDWRLTSLHASTSAFIESSYSFSFWMNWKTINLGLSRELFTFFQMLKDSGFQKTTTQQIRNLAPIAYGPIKSPDGIRLLLIHPRRSIDPIRCALFEAELSNLPSYEALSYCWGSGEFTESIIVNDKSLIVTANAHEALRKRSSALRPRLVWIDSICINQQDDIEKARQVGLMGNIYRNAKLVSVVLIVELKAEDFRQEALTLLGNDFTATYFDTPNSSESTDVQDFTTELIKYGSAASAADMVEELRSSYYLGEHGSAATFQKYSRQRHSYRMRCFREFLSNPWFERTWVVQEVALAQNILLVYGHQEIRWSALKNALSLIQMHSLLSGPILESGSKAGERRPPPVGSISFQTFDAVRELVIKDEQRNLVDLLRNCRLLKSTKPRDKLFAIYGLLANLPAGLIRPTYDKSTTLQEVFLRAALGIIIQGDAAKLLSNAGNETSFFLTKEEETEPERNRTKGPEEETSEIELPSWVPNWAKMQRGRPLSFLSPEIDYCAGGKAALDVSISGCTLIVAGYTIDEIQEEHSLYNPLPMNRRTNALHIIRELAGAYKEAKKLILTSKCLKDPYPWWFYEPKQSLAEAFWRTLIGNRADTVKPAPASLASSVEVMEVLFAKVEGDLEYFDNKTTTPEWQAMFQPMAKFTHPLHEAWAGRKLCVTGRGLLGLAPGDCRAGDVVAIFPGMQVPCVLRRVAGAGAPAGQPQWKYIGESYIHGMMSGEALCLGLEYQKFELV